MRDAGTRDKSRETLRRIPSRSRRAHRTLKEPFWRWARIGGWGAFALWAVGLGIYSTVIYHRCFLGEDFATYNQAWTLIGTGHLNPYDTVYGFPFVKADFELIIWPLALIHLILPSPIVLLWIQDLAVAATGLVAFLWVLDILERSQVAMLPTFGVAAAFVLVNVANPGIYMTLGFDVHMEPIATLFLVLAARDLWRGHTRRAWIFVVLVLLCGSFAAISLVGLGVSALLAGRDTRRSGLALVAAGIAWTALISLLHANQGSGLFLYAYLADRSSVSGLGGVIAILAGILRHPLRVLDHLRERVHDVWLLIRPVGVIGLVSAWGFGVPFVVLLTNALNSRPDFITNPFQSFAVFPFLSVGTVIVLVWLSSRFRGAVVLATLIGLGVVAQSAELGYKYSPAVTRFYVNSVGPAQGAQLRTALSRTPPNAEVIATITVMGRFSGREFCYFFYPNGARPVDARNVVFVFDSDNEVLTSPVGIQHAVEYVHDDLHARVLVDADGIVALDWRPPPGIHNVTVPTGTRVL